MLQKSIAVCKIKCQPRMTRLSLVKSNANHVWRDYQVTPAHREIWGVTWICKLRSVQTTGTCYPGLGWFVRNQVYLTNTAEVWVACPDILPSPWFVQKHTFSIFLIPLWVWLETLLDCHRAQCPQPLSIVIKMRLVISQSNRPACFADVQAGCKKLSDIYATALVKLTDQMDEICIKFTA